MLEAARLMSTKCFRSSTALKRRCSVTIRRSTSWWRSLWSRCRSTSRRNTCIMKEHFKFSQSQTQSVSLQHLRQYNKEKWWSGFHYSYHCVAHLIPRRQQVDLSEKLPDTWLGWVRASRQQHVEVTHKVLQRGLDTVRPHFIIFINLK